MTCGVNNCQTSVSLNKVRTEPGSADSFHLRTVESALSPTVLPLHPGPASANSTPLSHRWPEVLTSLPGCKFRGLLSPVVSPAFAGSTTGYKLKFGIPEIQAHGLQVPMESSGGDPPGVLSKAHTNAGVGIVAGV